MAKGRIAGPGLTALLVASSLVLSSCLAACTAFPAPNPDPSNPTTTPPVESPSISTPSSSTTEADPPLSQATFSAVTLDVAFAFDYPTTWKVTNQDPTNQYQGGPFVVTNEEGTEVASLLVLPSLHAEPCRGVCADTPVSYLAEVPGENTVGDRSFTVRTMAMDLTSRSDLRNANEWLDHVKLVVGVNGAAGPGSTDMDPVHFVTGSGVQTGETAESIRPLSFGAVRYFESLSTAKGYTASAEHAQIQGMLASLRASPASAAAKVKN